MTAQQRIIRVRRNYNQWVANQTLEDYALRFTAKTARRWSSLRVANTAIGAVSFLALEAIGGSITINYGFANAAAAIMVVGVVILLTSLPIAYYASKYGVDIDLLTRGAGFGYLGSTITSLIYASFTFLFFAIEAAIMSLAFEMCLGIPPRNSLRILCRTYFAIQIVRTHEETFIRHPNHTFPDCRDSSAVRLSNALRSRRWSVPWGRPIVTWFRLDRHGQKIRKLCQFLAQNQAAIRAG
jgi:hypothetical protein